MLSISGGYRMGAKFVAAAVAATIAISQVPAPPPAPVETVRSVRAHDIELTAVATHVMAATTGRDRGTSNTHATASLSPAETVFSSALYTVGAIALAPVWYVAFPVTLPL